MPDLREQLFHCFGGRTCLVGVGNPDRSDDGLGVKLAEQLQSMMEDSEIVIAGSSPEAVLPRLRSGGFDHVIFLDAVDFLGAHGAVVLLDSGEMTSRFPQVSTHKLSLGLLAKWIESNGTTRAWLLGIQPAWLQPGTTLSPTVQETLDVLTELLGNLWRQACHSDRPRASLPTRHQQWAMP